MTACGKVYGYMAKHLNFLKEPIDGLDDDVRLKMHAIFKAWWDYFHKPIFTCAYHFEPEFAHNELDLKERADVHNYFWTVYRSDAEYSEVLAEISDYEECLSLHVAMLNENLAFGPAGKAMPSRRWAKVSLAKWPKLQFTNMRVLDLECSASGCEHFWSIEGCIHSCKRNRLGLGLGRT